MANVILTFAPEDPEIKDLYKSLFLSKKAIISKIDRFYDSRFIFKIRSGGCKLIYKYLEDEINLLKDCKRKWLDQEPDITDLYNADLTSLIDSAIEKISIMLTKLKKDSADYIVINHFENCDSLHSYGGGCMMGGSFSGRPGNCTCGKRYWDYFEQKILKGSKEA